MLWVGGLVVVKLVQGLWVVGRTCRSVKGRIGARRDMVAMWMVGLMVMSLIGNLWFIVRMCLNEQR